eukprot:1756777-Pleurochrysis_carterae.AAC.1
MKHKQTLTQAVNIAKAIAALRPRPTARAFNPSGAPPAPAPVVSAPARAPAGHRPRTRRPAARTASSGRRRTRRRCR